jgi:hypothetical protein
MPHQTWISDPIIVVMCFIIAGLIVYYWDKL